MNSAPHAPHEPPIRPALNAAGTGALAPDVRATLNSMFTPEQLSSSQYQNDLHENNLPLKATAAGRFGIRSLSRGVTGVAAFTWGENYAAKQMQGYTPHGPAKNGMQFCAKTFDAALGEPLKKVINLLGGDGEKFLTFRPTVKFEGYRGMGRSFAAEVWAVTFGFSMMSIGDFWGRKLADTLDPNIRPDWIRPDHSVDLGKAATTFGKNWWSALTHSAGEDWVTGPIYVNLIGTPFIDKIIPGYRFDYDRNGCGTTFILDSSAGKYVNAAEAKLAESATRAGEKVMDYAISHNLNTAGFLNIAERFTTYNIFTLMFREAYSETGTRLKQWWQGKPVDPWLAARPGAPAPTTDNPVGDAFEAGKQLTRWAARDVIKAGLYMPIPAMAFAMIRVPQHRYRAYFLDLVKGPLQYIGKDGKEMFVRANSLLTDKDFFTHTTPVFFGITKEAARNPFGPGGFAHHGHNFGVLDTMLTPIGKLSDQARGVALPLGKWLENHEGFMNQYLGMGLDVSPLSASRAKNGDAVLNTYVNAALAYTPYFWLKSDVFSHAWDNGRTDIAIERVLDGIAKLNGTEIRKGVGEIGRALTNQPLNNPQREQEALCRIASDRSASESAYEFPSASPDAACNVSRISKDMKDTSTQLTQAL